MKVTIAGVEYEGTPDEIAALMRTLAPAPSPAGAAPQHDPSQDEALFTRFLQRASMTPGRAQTVVRVMRRLKARIAPRSILDATKKDVQDMVEDILTQCRNLYTFHQPTRTPGWHRCDAGRFDRDLGAPSTIPVLVRGAGVKPDFCKATCPAYEMNIFVANETLQFINSFYNFFEDDITKHPVRTLLPQYASTLQVAERTRSRHNPGLAIVRRIILGTKDLTKQTLFTLAVKSGRRRGELRLITWPMVNLEKGWIDLEHVRQEKLRMAGRGRTKMHRYACRYLFLDEEAKTKLRRYRTYWEGLVKRDEKGEPLTLYLWLGRYRDGPASGNTLESWFQDAIEDAGLTEELDESKDRKRTTFHCLRHCFTTESQRPPRKAPRDFVKYLRGDVMGDAMARYEHKPPEEVREEYLPYALDLRLDQPLEAVA